MPAGPPLVYKTAIRCHPAHATLRSSRAFERVSFVGSSTVEGALWGPRRAECDVAARLAYRSLAEEPMRLDDVFIIDLIRREG